MTCCVQVASELTLIVGGHVIAGSCLSLTVMENVQVSEFPEASVAVEVTVVVPTGKFDPDAGTETTVTVLSLIQI